MGVNGAMKSPLHYALLPLLDGFGAAWESVDAALASEQGEGPLVLRDGTDRAAVAALRVEMAERLEAVRAQLLAERVAQGREEVLRGQVLRRLKEFRACTELQGRAGPEVPKGQRRLAGGASHRREAGTVFGPGRGRANREAPTPLPGLIASLVGGVVRWFRSQTRSTTGYHLSALRAG